MQNKFRAFILNFLIYSYVFITFIQTNIYVGNFLKKDLFSSNLRVKISWACLFFRLDKTGHLVPKDYTFETQTNRNLIIKFLHLNNVIIKIIFFSHHNPNGERKRRQYRRKKERRERGRQRGRREEGERHFEMLIKTVNSMRQLCLL